MSNLFKLRGARLRFLMLASTFLISACGGSNPDTAMTPPVATASTGTMVVLLTGTPVENLSAIYLDVTEVLLIGSMGQQVVFSGNKTINLLDLANYHLPIALGEVTAGSYTKLRLRIENVELVDKNSGMSTIISLPANGKIDLLDRNGFAVFPGRSLIADINFDAKKSIHIIGTGNDKFQFRPVVKVNFMDGGLPAKLVRLEGFVAEIFDDLAGRFLVCDFDETDHCVIVNLAEGGSVFDAEGLPVAIGELMLDDLVVAIGAFRHEDDDDSDSDDDRVDMDLELDAIVIEIGGNARQVKGVVVSVPDENGKFQLAVGQETITVVVQDGTKIFGVDGELGPDAIVVDETIVVEGVLIESDEPDQFDGINAALIFIGDVVDDEMLSGKIVEPLDANNATFILATDIGDLCVQVIEDGIITLISKGDDGSVSEKGEFSDLAAGQSVEAFGHSGVAGCFLANEVVVDLTG